ncbi:MAG: hypothetical protein GY760_10490 [Deltaproteobacteria bacterium]|nr:hypothetical protein [Deltaproteobacteria bacterium]
MSYYSFPKYVSVDEKRAKAKKQLKSLKKVNRNIQPVILNGKALAKTWWGKEWNKNLERYADYSNRIGRGRSYVRHNAVLDLKIKPGEVTALVQGSDYDPYSLSISIKPITRKKWNEIKKICKGKMDSIKQLVGGKFPIEIGEVFTRKEKGLFPSPKEIKFNCDCPDWADMCKHIAAVLYGIGARLDEDPGLFFVLRKVNINDLISETVKESKKELLLKARKKTSRIIENESNLSDLFGIALTDKKDKVKTKNGKKVTTKLKKINKPKHKKKAVRKKSSNTKKVNIRKLSDIESIEKIIPKRKKGITTPEIIEKSDIEVQKVRNCIYRLKSMGRIENISRGIYRKL